MARKLRLEFPGAIYHSLNRGNRRVGPFEEAATRDAFEACLFEACERSSWLLHAYVIMGNHFHLAVETPEGNLVCGMQWLQATFTNRFNRFRDQEGYGSIFQGRYKALLVERGPALGRLCDYIHLNPVRAGLVPLEHLRTWRWSSYRWLRQKTRPPWLRVDTALREAGDLPDSAAGWAAYDGFLGAKLPGLPFGTAPSYSPSKGWLLGTDAYRTEIVKKFDLAATTRAWEVEGAAEVSNIRCLAMLTRCLSALDKQEIDTRLEPKGAPWKVAIAAWLKRHSDASNEWISGRLGMGTATRVSQVVGLVVREPSSPAATLFRGLSEKLAT